MAECVVCPECWSSNTEVLSVSSDLMNAKVKCNNCGADFVSYRYNNKKNNSKENDMKTFFKNYGFILCRSKSP